MISRSIRSLLSLSLIVILFSTTSWPTPAEAGWKWLDNILRRGKDDAAPDNSPDGDWSPKKEEHLSEGLPGSGASEDEWTSWREKNEIDARREQEGQNAMDRLRKEEAQEQKDIADSVKPEGDPAVTSEGESLLTDEGLELRRQAEEADSPGSSSADEFETNDDSVPTPEPPEKKNPKNSDDIDIDGDESAYLSNDNIHLAAHNPSASLDQLDSDFIANTPADLHPYLLATTADWRELAPSAESDPYLLALDDPDYSRDDGHLVFKWGHGPVEEVYTVGPHKLLVGSEVELGDPAGLKILPIKESSMDSDQWNFFYLQKNRETLEEPTSI